MIHKYTNRWDSRESFIEYCKQHSITIPINELEILPEKIAFVHNHGFIYGIELSFDDFFKVIYSEKSEFKEWLKDINAEWTPVQTSKQNFKFFFKDEDDATLFKLRWI